MARPKPMSVYAMDPDTPMGMDSDAPAPMSPPPIMEGRWSGGQVDNRRHGDVGSEWEFDARYRHDENMGDDCQLGLDVNDGAHSGRC